MGFVGLFFLIFAVTLGVQTWGELGEKGLTAIGASLVALSHFKNYRLCRKIDCEECH